MTSKGKEIYNTIKRSLGSQSFGIAGSSNHTNGVRYSGGTSSKWIHPPGLFISLYYTAEDFPELLVIQIFLIWKCSGRCSTIADVLLNGRVEYSVKMLGFAEVSEPKGTHVIRDAIHAIRFQLQVIILFVNPQFFFDLLFSLLA